MGLIRSQNASDFLHREIVLFQIVTAAFTQSNSAKFLAVLDLDPFVVVTCSTFPALIAFVDRFAIWCSCYYHIDIPC